MLNNNRPGIVKKTAFQIFVIQLFLYIFLLNGTSKVVWAQNPDQSNETDTNPIIRFYQRHISKIDGHRCPMYPSCSRYSAQAVKKHGLALGWIMACDRLLRCGRDEVRLSPHVKSNGRELTLDPVSANDFWWFSPQPSGDETNLTEKKAYDSDSGRMSDLNPNQQK
jgi:putative membrane protein insertion efficiency factor